MLSPNPAVKFTYEDYQHTPEDKRYELLDGELIMVPAPNLEHQRIGIRLGALLHGFVQERGLGEVFHAPCDVVLSNTDVVQPDLLFVSNERAHLLLGGANVLGAPDLVVEILSPSTAGRDRTLKRAPVRQVWREGILASRFRRPDGDGAAARRGCLRGGGHLRRGANDDLVHTHRFLRWLKRDFLARSVASI